MYLRNWHVALTIALAAPLVACSSNDGDEAPQTSEPDPKDPNRWGDAARPCGNLNTGYRGDDNCIQPPPPGRGFQFHYGPKDYTEAEMSKWLIGPGEEVTDCILIDTPNTEEIYYNEYHARLRPGSHHMLLFTIPNDLPDSDQPQRSCNEGFGQRNIFGAQTEVIDVKRESDAPENFGLATRLPARQQGIMQLHFFNTHPTDNMLKEAWANLIYVEDVSTVTQLADPIFFISGVTMNVALGEREVIKGHAIVPPEADPEFRLIIGTGHFHAHTERFSAWTTIAGQKELLFEDFDWHEPEMFRFDSKTVREPSDSAARKNGGRGGAIYLAPGDRIDWECEVFNGDKTRPLGFGNEVYNAEMCNVFGLYAPSLGGPWASFPELSGGR
jgi:hypothetical protein